jgi:hypothetical protein
MGTIMTDEKEKPALDEMWYFIDTLMRPNQLVPDKSILTYDDVFAFYSKLMDLNQVFRETIQIRLLGKGIEKENNLLIA